MPAGVAPSDAGVIPGSQSGAARPGDSKFVQCSIGNRNVKSIYVDVGVVWIGTSGGVIRYDVAADKHQLFDYQMYVILSNVVFHVSRVCNRLVVGTYGGDVVADH